MDLSYSMKDDLENVKNLGTDLMKEMQEITSDFRIGEENSNSPVSRCYCKTPTHTYTQYIYTHTRTHQNKETKMFSPLGFGSFVEKTVMPYISTTPARLINPCTGNQNCTSPFSYKNVLTLTGNGNEFNRLVSQQQISGNLDSPEGGFDAIMQVAVCEVGLFFLNLLL